MKRPDGAVLSVLRWSTTQPWFSPYHDLIAECAALAPIQAIELLNQRSRERAVCNHAGRPIRFVAADQLDSAERSYETRIATTGEVATRTDAHWGHDFFNACVWLSFPATKAALNRFQAIELADARRAGLPRTARGDRATLFDESAALLLAVNDPLRDAWAEQDWPTLFVARRAHWAEVGIVLFGHGLLDKMRRPFKAVTAQAWLIDRPAQSQSIDQAIAARLAQWLDDAAARRPLPLAGIPGWCDDNDAPDFYADRQVFRPRAPGRGRLSGRILDNR